MKDQLQKLWSLQSLDSILDSARKRKAKLPEEIAASEKALADAEAAKKTTDAEIESNRLTRKKLEGDIASNDADILKFTQQLGQVKTNEQYTALEHEIQHLRDKNGGIEEEILALMERDEELAQILLAAQKGVAAAVANVEKTRADAAEEEKALDEECAHLTDRRDAALAEIDPAARAKYEAIQKSVGVIAVSRIVRDACEACYRQVPDQRQIEVRQAVSLVTCEGCGRILYWEGGE